MKEPIHILLADDDESDRLLFVEALVCVKTPTIVNAVDNGTELMNYLNMASTILPDILFLDLNMPRKNGIECLKEMKDSKKLNAIFIAIFSTSASPTDIVETFIGGAIVYVKKPNNFELLIAVVKKAIAIAGKHEKLFSDRSNFLLRV